MKRVIILLLLPLLFSCNKENEELKLDNTSLDVREFSFKYKGEIYNANFILLNEEVVYLNEEINDVLEGLMKNSDIFHIVQSDGILEFFDNEKEYWNSLLFKDFILPPLGDVTRGEMVPFPTYNIQNSYSLELKLNEDKNRGGREFLITRNKEANLPLYQETFDLNQFGLSKKLSSHYQRVYSYPGAGGQAFFYFRLEFREGAWFYFFNFAVDHTCPYREIRNYKDYPVIGGTGTWNDRAECLTMIY